MYSIGEVYSISCMGRSRVTIDPRIPTMPGTELIGFSPARQTLLACTKREAKREVSGWSHGG